MGPVNWHGYQSALMNLHRTKFASMPFEAFRSKIVTDKSEEAVQAWQEAVSKRTAWKPVREGASEVLLESPAAVEQDFESNHFEECYDVTDKVFVNGAVKKNHLSPGLWAHLIQLSGTTRRHPSMLIPNLCHGWRATTCPFSSGRATITPARHAPRPWKKAPFFRIP